MSECELLHHVVSNLTRSSESSLTFHTLPIQSLLQSGATQIPTLTVHCSSFQSRPTVLKTTWFDGGSKPWSIQAIADSQLSYQCCARARKIIPLDDGGPITVGVLRGLIAVTGLYTHVYGVDLEKHMWYLALRLVCREKCRHALCTAAVVARVAVEVR